MSETPYIKNDRKNLKRLRELAAILENQALVHETDCASKKIDIIINDVKPIIDKERTLELKLKYYETLLSSIMAIIANSKDII